MDKPRANTATAHKLAWIGHFMLTRGEAFVTWASSATKNSNASAASLPPSAAPPLWASKSPQRPKRPKRPPFPFVSHEQRVAHARKVLGHRNVTTPPDRQPPATSATTWACSARARQHPRRRRRHGTPITNQLDSGVVEGRDNARAAMGLQRAAPGSNRPVKRVWPPAPSNPRAEQLPPGRLSSGYRGTRPGLHRAIPAPSGLVCWTRYAALERYLGRRIPRKGQ